MGKQTNYSPTFPMFPGGATTFTNSNTAYLPTPSVIYVGVTGDVKVTTAQGDDTVFVAVPAGQVVPVQVIRVWATGTTASSMLRIY